MKRILKYILAVTLGIMAIESISLCAYAYAQTQTETNNRLVAVAQYQTPLIPKPDTLPGPPESAQAEAKDQKKILINTLIPRLTVMLTGGAAGTAFLFLVVGGVRFATSYGNDQAIESARKQITYALVGLFLAMMSYIIVTIIINLQVFQS